MIGIIGKVLIVGMAILIILPWLSFEQSDDPATYRVRSVLGPSTIVERGVLSAREATPLLTK